MALTRTVRRKTARERLDRSYLEMIVSVPWRKNEDDAKMDGERFRREFMMDEDYKEKLVMEEHVPVPKRVYITRDILEVFWVHSEMSWVHVVAQGHGETSAHRNCRRRIEERHCEGGSSTKARVATSGQSSREENERNEVEPRGMSDGCANNNEFEQQQQRGTGTQGAVATQREQAAPDRRVNDKRKADGEHREDPEREDGKWIRTVGNNRKTVEGEVESMLRKTVKYRKTLERADAQKESEETLAAVEVAEVEVNEEEEVQWRTEGGAKFKEEGGDLEEQLQRYSMCVCRCAWRRLHVRSHGFGAEEDAIDDVRMCGSGKVMCARLRHWEEVQGGQRKGWSTRRVTNIARHCWKESKTVNSAAVKPEEIGHAKDRDMLEGTEKTRFRSLSATLNHMSLDMSNVQCAAKEICTKMANQHEDGGKGRRRHVDT